MNVEIEKRAPAFNQLVKHGTACLFGLIWNAMDSFKANNILQKSLHVRHIEIAIGIEQNDISVAQCKYQLIH